MQLTLNEQAIWVSNQTIDFRKSIDGLCATVMLEFSRNPQEGLYVFINKNLDKVKVLGWHKNGFALVYKRLEKGKFTLSKNQEGLLELTNQQLSWLVAGLDWFEMSGWSELEFNNFY